jgi:tRNA(fMet)-specific endonuclease VapC
MKYLLDTNACIRYLNETAISIARRITQAGRRNVGTSSIVIEELYFDAFRSARVVENVAKIRLFAATLEVWAFDSRAAHESARIRAHLAGIGQTIGPFDNLIAGTALACGATVVTNNVGEFGRVPGLRVEDWQGEKP